MTCSWCNTTLHATRGSYIVVNTVCSNRRFCEVLCMEAYRVRDAIRERLGA